MADTDGTTIRRMRDGSFLATSDHWRHPSGWPSKVSRDGGDYAFSKTLPGSDFVAGFSAVYLPEH